MNGPNATVVNWFLSALPIVLLIATILKLRWSAPRSGGVAWLVATVLAFTVFGASADQVAVASAKGLALALFVLSIVWTSVFMFNMVDRLKGIDAIGRTMSRLVDDRLAQALLIAWGFASFIQGITGFGVPVAVAAPLLIMLGFPPVQAAAMTLIGHGWAVTFGSMGSSYYTIQLVSGINGSIIGPHMAFLFGPSIVLSGLLVAHIQGGLNAVRRSFFLVLIVGTLMAVLQYTMAWVGAPQIASSVPALAALVAIPLLARTPLLIKGRQPLQAPAGAASDAAVEVDQKARVPFWLAALPYLLLITFSILSQLPAMKELGKHWRLGLDFPGSTTSQGFQVAPEHAYAAISLINHPAPLVILSVLISALGFVIAGRWRKGVAWESLKLTYGQCTSTTAGVATMVMMAIVMADTGMTALLAQGVATASGPLFPFVSPFIGLLGSFMTGSNTNSNVMFGALQVETAHALGIGSVTIAGIQSLGASLGSSMAPAKVLVGAAIVGLSSQENEIFRKVIPYVVGLVAIVGIQALVLILFLPHFTR